MLRPRADGAGRWPLLGRERRHVRAEVFPDAVMFNGTYRSQDEPLCALKDRFVVQLFDQGEPGSSRGEIIEDRFSVELFGDTPTPPTPEPATSRAATFR
jgi:hypothetical protein